MEMAMAPRSAINPGTIDWSGENPCMYLKERDDGPFVSLLSFFRVVLSPKGRGHALVVVEAPQAAASKADALNVVVADNEPLARWLVADYLSHFPAFKGAPALANLEYRRLTEVRASGDQGSTYVESVQGDGFEARLAWEGVGAPFLLEAPPDKSVTGRHWLYSVIAAAERGSAVVNGRRLKGRATPREMYGRAVTSCFLAFSETWVRA
jgi:hypothetical protein